MRDKEKDKERSRKYRKNNPEKVTATIKNWRSKNPIKAATYRNNWKNRNQEKVKAHNAVQYAIKSGKLARQPCQDCGSSNNIHAHHEDYSKPMDVIWLCRWCHQLRHRASA